MNSNHCVLLVSQSEKSTTFFKRILSENGYYSVTAVSYASEAKRLLISGQYDILLVNSPLRDETGYEMAFDASENSYMGIVLFVSAANFEHISYTAEKYGVLTVQKPVSSQEVGRVINLASTMRERIRTLEKKNIKLQEKMDEIRIVDRAKLVLIASLDLDEPQAHRYIEKNAMDMRITKREAAEMIIKTYEK